MAKTKELAKTTLSALVADAFSELEGLGGELRDWYENLPDSLKDHRSDIEEAADTLEGLSEPDSPPSQVAEMEVAYAPLRKRKTSRRERGDQAAYELGVAIDYIEEFIDDEDHFLDMTPEDAEALKDELRSWSEEVQSVRDEAEGVVYPGMYA